MTTKQLDRHAERERKRRAARMAKIIKRKRDLSFKVKPNHQELGARIRQLIEQGMGDVEIVASTKAQPAHVACTRAAMQREESYKWDSIIDNL